LLQVLKQITWTIVAMKIARVIPAMVKRGAENGARESR